MAEIIKVVCGNVANLRTVLRNMRRILHGRAVDLKVTSPEMDEFFQQMFAGGKKRLVYKTFDDFANLIDQLYERMERDAFEMHIFCQMNMDEADMLQNLGGCVISVE